MSLIRSGQAPIRFSIKRTLAEDVAKGKGDVSEVFPEQRRYERPGRETGEEAIPDNERVLPSRLEQLIGLSGRSGARACKDNFMEMFH